MQICHAEALKPAKTRESANGSRGEHRSARVFPSSSELLAGFSSETLSQTGARPGFRLQIRLFQPVSGPPCNKSTSKNIQKINNRFIRSKVTVQSPNMIFGIGNFRDLSTPKCPPPKMFGNVHTQNIVWTLYCNFTSNKSIVDFLVIFRCRFQGYFFSFYYMQKKI